jgi:thioredoxin reductase (NADPH)
MNTAEVIIIGAGPAGLAAAITLASEGRSVILIEKNSQAGGQAGTSSMIENYPPFPNGFSGAQFTTPACEQCRKFGVRIEYNTEVKSIIPGCDFTLYTNRGQFHARAVLLALGLQNRWLGVPGEDHPRVFHGMNTNAIDYILDSHVVLVGGGNSVGQAALFYLDQGAHVKIIARRPLRETMSDYLVKRIQDRITLHIGNVKRFTSRRNGLLEVMVNGIYIMDVHCVHIFIGQQPATGWIAPLVRTDRNGYIVTDRKHQTSRPGIFAIGDVTSESVKRVACAVGHGNECVPAIHTYLDELARGGKACAVR